MMLFETSAAEKLQVYEIATEMKKDTTLSPEFITAAVDLALKDQGVFELLSLWIGSIDADEKAEIVSDIQEMIDEYTSSVAGPVKKPKVDYKDINEVVKKVTAFKKKLRDLIDQKGGITALARKTGIPQPSLSRMFTSGSMPRRTTLYKIAEALGLEEKEIISDWTR